MTNKYTISNVRALQVLDSRGRPTVEAEVQLEDGTVGRASVPSGASTGTYEAHELRDGDPDIYGGLGVLKAVANVNDELAPLLKSQNILNQSHLDSLMTHCDGTPDLRRLGANAILSVSLAICRAGAASLKAPLHAHIGALAGVGVPTMPMPMVNILSGGQHASFGMDVQDFLVMPLSANSFQEAIRMVGQVRDAAASVMRERGMSTLLADEGGLSPGFATAREALQLLEDAISKTGMRSGRDVGIAIDVAATSLTDKSRQTDIPEYFLRRANKRMNRSDMIGEVTAWVREYGVVSIEDALDEEDWSGWTALTEKLGSTCQLVGDDLFTTNTIRVRRGIGACAANSILIKLNQNGTLSGTLEVIAVARAAGYRTVVSARSGETEDDFMADLAVATGAGQIKIGSLRGGERLCKYNRLLRIEDRFGLNFAKFDQRRP